MSGTYTQRTRKRWFSIGLGLALGLLVIAAVAVLIRYRAGDSVGMPQMTSFSEYQGTRLDDRPAPDFRLTDQRGTLVSLADLRGNVVVITLLDPYCTDICPIYAYQFRLAYEALGDDAARVKLLAFNANQNRASVDDVMAATRKWGVDGIPAWHFLTGDRKELQAAWDAYGMVASGPPKPDRPSELSHSPAVFIIDQAGRRRWYLSTGFEGAPPLDTLIVQHARTLLRERR